MSGTTSTIITVLILILILFFAIKNSIPHFKGQGACCGGGNADKLIKPKKLKNVIATRIIHIEGMRCNNCRVRIQNKLNEIDGVSAKVNLEKKIVTVQMDRDIPDKEFVKTIESMGYEAEVKQIN